MQREKYLKRKQKRIFSKPAGKTIQKAEEEVLPDIFFAGFEEANTGFENTSYYFIESVLSER